MIRIWYDYIKKTRWANLDAYQVKVAGESSSRERIAENSEACAQERNILTVLENIWVSYCKIRALWRNLAGIKETNDRTLSHLLSDVKVLWKCVASAP